MLKKFVQQGRSERSTARRTLLGYVEHLIDARTKLADFFSILLRPFLPGPQPPRRNHPIHTLNGFEHLIEMAGCLKLPRQNPAQLSDPPAS